jgi:hypothetical protein
MGVWSLTLREENRLKISERKAAEKSNWTYKRRCNRGMEKTS